MRQFIFLLVGLVLAGAIAVTAMDWGKAPPPEHGGETADRLSMTDMEHMVAGPMKLVCLTSASMTAGLVRNRLHKRPRIDRARATEDT